MSTDPFSTLGLPARFDLTPEDIRRAFLARSAALHPDRAGPDRTDDEEDVLNAAADLNRARETLADPEKRAEALLATLGGPSKEADKSLPPAFLMQIMETREAMEAELAAGGTPARQKWRDWSRAERRRYAAEVGALFQATPPKLADIRRALNAWRYIERLAEQLA